LLGGEVGNHPALLRELNALLEGSEFAVSQLALGALGIPAALLGAVSISLEPTVLRLLHAPRQLRRRRNKSVTQVGVRPA
jgi:hypothetical protein